MGGGGRGGAARLSRVFSFPCSADHERDWPPCKVVFGLASNTLNVKNNNNNNKDEELKTFWESIVLRVYRMGDYTR